MTSTLGLPRAGDLGDDVLHVPGRQELALLDVDDLAGLRGGDQQVGLAAQEGRDLQDVDDAARRSRTAPRCARRSAPARRVRCADRRRPAAPLPARRRACRRARCGSPCRSSSCRRGRCRASPSVSFSAPAMSKACWRDLELARAGDQRQRRVLENTALPTVTVALGAIIEPRTDMLSAMCLNSADRSSAALLSRGHPAMAYAPAEPRHEPVARAACGSLTDQPVAAIRRAEGRSGLDQKA